MFNLKNQNQVVTHHAPETRISIRGRSRDTGFTLLELLIVAVAILMLISMLLPAVQQVRESARNRICQNNLLQLGIAVANYESNFMHLPPGTINDWGPITYDELGRDISFLVLLLPYLEQSRIFERFDFELGSYAIENLELVERSSPNFLFCPSSTGAILSYAGCHHHVEAPIDVDNMGLLFLNSRIRNKDILDGRSHTILIGEKTDSYLNNWMSGTGETLRNTSYVDSRNAAPSPNTNNLFVGGFSSYHPGGVHFCMADGSVRAIDRRIDLTILQNLGHRADGAMY